MYMTSSTEQPFSPPVLPFRAVSRDGIEWKLEPKTPLLTTTKTSFLKLETPSVVYFKGMYHMYLSGIRQPGKGAPIGIVHAASPDGIVWTLDRDREVVLDATGQASDWNGYLVAEPGAVVRGDEIWLYFNATGARPGGRPPQVCTIGLARSSDGFVFGLPKKVLEQSDVYPASQGDSGYSTPAPLLYNGKVHLFYDVMHYDENLDSPLQQVAIHHAVSENGERFAQDAAPIFTREDFDWTDGGEMIGPTALVHGSTAMMWFAGHGEVRAMVTELLTRGSGRLFGIGVATMDAGLLDQPAPKPSEADRLPPAGDGREK